jgi:hypothetical protein
MTGNDCVRPTAAEYRIAAEPAVDQIGATAAVDQIVALARVYVSPPAPPMTVWTPISDYQPVIAPRHVDLSSASVKSELPALELMPSPLSLERLPQLQQRQYHRRAEREHFFAAVSTVFACNLNAMPSDYLNSLCIDRKDIYS